MTSFYCEYSSYEGNVASVPNYPSMQTCGGGGLIFETATLDARKWLSSLSGRFIPEGLAQVAYRFDRDWVGPRVGLGTVVGKSRSAPPAGTRILAVQSVASAVPGVMMN
jgi:hypothetical protein